MPKENGVDFLESIIPMHPDPMRILLTGYTDIQAVIDAINKGKVYHYLTKPWEEDYLRTVVKMLTKYSPLGKKQTTDRQPIEGK